MEYETINKKTPEMKQLISGIKEVSKRFRRLPKRTVRSSGEKSTLRDERSANGFSSARVPCRTIGTRALFPTSKSQGKSFIDTPTSTDYSKRSIGDKAFTRSFSLMFDNHTERTYRMVVQKIPSNLAIARYLFAINQVHLRY